MRPKLHYQDTATFVKVGSSGYANDKAVVEQEDVPVIFLQGTGFVHQNSQDAVTSDAIVYPDPSSQFVQDNWNRLEGMYLLAPLFGVDSDDGWYKITNVLVNRDHLLGNQIDNIECQLKKTRRIANVS
jgi:hypothetical protein